MRIARKFTLAVIAGIVAVHSAAAAYRVQRERNLLEDTAARDATVLGRAIGHAVEKTWVAHGSEAALGLVAHATERETQVIRWVRTDLDDGVLEHKPDVAAGDLTALATGETVVTTQEAAEGQMLYVYVPVPTPDYRHGAIEVAHPLGEEQQYLRRSVENVLILTLALVLLCAIVTWVLGARLLGAPVRTLVEQARAIGAGVLNRRLRWPVRDELGELGAEIDLMCDQLQDAAASIEEETQSRIAAVEQLRHADRLRTVGTLASGIAHELGTPLNVVQGHAALIREEQETSDSVKEGADAISRQCKRMAAIIRQLLDFARRGSAPGPTRADVVEVVKQTRTMVAPMASKRDVDILVEASEPRVAAINPESLQQVLANLLINGVHATPPDGQVRVRVEGRTVRRPEASQAREVVVIEVADTGVGMDAEEKHRVFEPFFTTKDVGEGTGLGLAVAHGIVDDAGGWIDLTSAPGEGCLFTVCLPVERPDG